jgi:acetyl-CoA carboxylase carboxyltransferase component
MEDEDDSARVNDARDVDERRYRTTEELIDRLREAKLEVSDERRPKAVEKQHGMDKLTARERVGYLCDDGTFQEIGALAGPHPATDETAEWDRSDAPADGVVTGLGEIESRSVAIVATDFTVKGGSVGHNGLTKMKRVLRLALRRGFPAVLLHDGGGHRIQEALDARPFAHGDPSGPNGVLETLTKMSGWVPLVSAMMGPGFAAPTNFAAACEFVAMVEGTSTLGVAGPALVESALGIEITKEELGGARFHTAETGMADRRYASDEACLDGIREYLSYFPRNAERSPPRTDSFTAPSEDAVARLSEVIPNNPKKSYEVFDLIEGIVDGESFFEIKPDYGRNLTTGYARVEGRPVGVVANNPRIKAGTFDVPASDKVSHFISVCDAFGIPLLFLADVPGVLPGPDAERDGIARHSGKVTFEINRATVPKLSVVMRRGYGFGYSLMAAGRSTENDFTVVWPTAEIAGMGIQGAVEIAYRREVAEADDPEAKRRELVEKFTQQTGAIRAAEGFGIDAVIDPRETREWVIRALDRIEGDYGDAFPPKKHGINPI